MSAIEHLLREPAAQAIGWALLHFIWQGTLVAALTGMVLACLRKSAADIRYVVSAIGLSLMLTLPAVTAAQLWRSTTVSVPSAEPRASAASQKPAPERRNIVEAPSLTLASPATSRLIDSIRVEPWLPMLVFAWLCGVVVLSLRLVSGWLWVQRMKSHGTSPVEDGWNHIAARLSRRLHIGRRVRLLKSSLVDVPTVIGWVKPVILIPASALSGLNPHQLEAILAHELAHIRRHDYLVNLLQAVVETLLFYHPAVWWLSRRIRAERENCCDDLAVSLCGDPFTYAQALADLEGLRGSGRRFVMAANGGSLVQRVRRLLGAPSHAGRAPGWLAGSASVLVLLGIAIGTVGTDAFQSPAASAPASTPAVAATPQAEVVAAERAAVLAGRASTPSVRAQSDAAEHARELARAEAALRAVLAEQGKSLADQDRALALARDAVVASTSDVQFARASELLTAAARAIAASDAAHAREAVVASTPDARALVSDASRALAALDAARVASTPLFQSLAADSIVLAGGQTHGTYRWSNNGEKLEVSYDGEVEFTDDDTDVKRLSPGGLLKIRDGGMMTSLLGGHTVEFTADGSGSVTRRFWVGSSERPFEPEGHKWLALVLPRFIRQTGIGAPARVARILKAKGPAGVLAEVSLIEGSWGKRRYLTELLKTTSLDPATVRQVLVQAGREIDSDYELATLLIEQGDKLLVDDATRQAYFDAARSIDSDFEMHRVFSAAIKHGPVSPTLLASLLNASREIDSDFEEASLLIEVAKQQPLDNTTRPAFFSALETVQSDYEHRRVLSALGTRTDLSAETTAAMLLSGASVRSDFEAASFLLQMAKQQAIEGNLRAPFFRAVDSISSSFERGRVLQAVASRPDASPETILAVLRATATMNGSFEASQVLLTVASTHPVAGPSRDAYITAAEKLGDFEQGRVLAALVKNERRK